LGNWNPDRTDAGGAVLRAGAAAFRPTVFLDDGFPARFDFLGIVSSSLCFLERETEDTTDAWSTATRYRRAAGSRSSDPSAPARDGSR
jgi:hypothetical protein